LRYGHWAAIVEKYALPRCRAKPMVLLLLLLLLPAQHGNHPIQSSSMLG